MKKVLILCDYFPPHSGPRMGYLVKYLSRLGWESYVVAGEQPSRGGFDALTGFAKEVHIIPQKSHRKWNLLHILPFFWPYDYLRGEYDMLAAAQKICRERRIDVVLSSCTYGMFPNNTASKIAKEYNLPLVIDIRDLPAQNPEVPFFKLYPSQKMDRLRDKCSFISNRRFARGLKRADALVTISPWHVQWLKEHANPNTYLIYNGFDPESQVESSQHRVARQFQIVYTGTFGSKAGRDYTYLLESVARLRNRHVISPSDFRVSFYCGAQPRNGICERIAELGIGAYFEFLPFVPLADVSGILCAASILLVLTNKNGYHGIMTTKFFEYLAAGRPILSVTSDEELLEATIRETHAGCSARSVTEAEQFIEEKFLEWKRNGFVAGTTDKKKLSLFSRETQAGQFAELFDRLTLRGAEAAK